MIDVRVRQNDCIDACRVCWEGLPIAQAQLLEALKQAAVDQNLLCTAGHQVPGPCDSTGASQESQLHRDPLATCAGGKRSSLRPGGVLADAMRKECRGTGGIASVFISEFGFGIVFLGFR